MLGHVNEPSIERDGRNSLFGRQRNAGSASQSEVMTVAVGFSPRIDGKTEPRRIATLESALGREINLSGVAPRRRAVFPTPPVG